MDHFLAELKRRHIYRVAAAYAVLAWLLLQLVNNIAPVLDLPPWVARAFLLLLVIGFPVALFFAWMRELSPADGDKTAAATGKLDWVLIGALIVVIGLVSYQQLASTPGARMPQVQQQPVLPARQASLSPSGAISIAVLPFANVSGDVAQEFFSDGMTDEISLVLAKVQGLTVIGRASAFEFKNQNRDLRTIGQALGVTHLIEGSVRKVGDRVRITAQLVLTENGAQLWSDGYDRQLTDIFAIQEDIAQAIASSLRVPLGLAQGERLVTDRTGNLEAYDQYLRARALARAGDSNAAITVLEAVVARDPTFASAWALLALVYPSEGSDPSQANGTLEETPTAEQPFWNKAEMAAREAIRLDSMNALAYAGLANIDSIRRNWTASEDSFRRALALDPNEPDVLNRYSARLAISGRVKESLTFGQKLRTLEPFVPAYNVTIARLLITAGQNKEAIAILEATPSDSGGDDARRRQLARAYAAEGRRREAAETLLAIPVNQNPVYRRSLEDAARLLRSAPQNLPEVLPTLNPLLKFVYAYSVPDRALDYYEAALRLGILGGGFEVLWQSEFAPVRKTERFKSFVRNVGLVDYWRARGWPDLCRPVGADDFVCD